MPYLNISILIIRARTFEWVTTNAAIRTRQQNRLDLFNTQQALYLDELKRKVPKKDRTDFTVAKKSWFKSWKPIDAPKVPTAKKGYKAGTWVITQISFIGPNDNIQRYRASIMDENDYYSEYAENQYRQQIQSVNSINDDSTDYFNYFVVSAMFNVLLIVILCCICGAAVGYGLYHLMKDKGANDIFNPLSHV